MKANGMSIGMEMGVGMSSRSHVRNPYRIHCKYPLRLRLREHFEWFNNPKKKIDYHMACSSVNKAFREPLSYIKL